MKNSFMRKGIISVVISLVLTMLLTANVFAATTYLVKDGAFQNSGFINAGEAKDGTITGPGNWTQLNLGDSNADAPYLHIIVKAEGGDTAAAQIAVSDTYTFNLTDLGVTLNGEYQDVVLPVADQGITTLGWLNFMGLDGGSVTYTIKDVFLSDEANSSLTVSEAADKTNQAEEPAKDVPKTGENTTIILAEVLCLIGFAAGAIVLRKKSRA
jgi:hypothetical protein